MSLARIILIGIPRIEIPYICFINFIVLINPQIFYLQVPALERKRRSLRERIRKAKHHQFFVPKTVQSEHMHTILAVLAKTGYLLFDQLNRV